MNAKDAHITYEQARRRDNKPICRYCFGPCDPRSREYRGMTLCPSCYRDEPLNITTQHKEISHGDARVTTSNSPIAGNMGRKYTVNTDGL